MQCVMVLQPWSNLNFRFLDTRFPPYPPNFNVDRVMQKNRRTKKWQHSAAFNVLWYSNHGQILTSDFWKHVFPLIPQISMLSGWWKKLANKKWRHELNIAIRGEGRISKSLLSESEVKIWPWWLLCKHLADNFWRRSLRWVFLVRWGMHTCMHTCVHANMHTCVYASARKDPPTAKHVHDGAVELTIRIENTRRLFSAPPCPP